ncbi:hypothetical protein ACNKHK_14585 [Shigella flexneri]
MKATSSTVNRKTKAVIFALPFEPAAEAPDKEYDLWLSPTRSGTLHTGSMTRVVPELHRAFPEAGAVDPPAGCKPPRICVVAIRSAAISRRGEVISIVETRGRTVRPGAGVLPFFDAAQLVNNLTPDATDPLSKRRISRSAP